jgi:hypothetical protein
MMDYEKTGKVDVKGKLKQGLLLIFPQLTIGDGGNKFNAP